MENNVQITQLIYDFKNLTWRLDLHIRGNTSSVEITHNEATSILDNLKQGDETRVEVETAPLKGLIYYMPKPSAK